MPVLSSLPLPESRKSNAWKYRGRLRCNGTSELKPFWAFDVNPFSPFFNYSCVMPPSMMMTENPVRSSLRQYSAFQPIKKGEEVFDPTGKERLLCECECTNCVKDGIMTFAGSSYRRVGAVMVACVPASGGVAREVSDGSENDGPQERRADNSVLADALAGLVTDGVNSALAAAGVPFRF